MSTTMKKAAYAMTTATSTRWHTFSSAGSRLSLCACPATRTYPACCARREHLGNLKLTTFRPESRSDKTASPAGQTVGNIRDFSSLHVQWFYDRLVRARTP
jgi:hypothetical protein